MKTARALCGVYRALGRYAKAEPHGTRAIAMARTYFGLRDLDLAGALPPEIQVYTVFEAAVSANSRAPEAARALINFLIGPAAIRAIKAQGMEPGQ